MGHVRLNNKNQSSKSCHSESSKWHQSYQIHQDHQIVNAIKLICFAYSLEWSKSSKLSVKQLAFKNFTRAVKLPDFRLKIKNKCQRCVASFET